MASHEDKIPYKYDAFISYSRKDIDLARKLDKALVNYRPPKIDGIKYKRLNIFRDESDLIGSDYFDSIENYIEESRKLILICSPNSAKSEFVNDELKRFINKNGSGNIIPVIISGLPNNEVENNQEEFNAFPPALVQEIKMPLANEYRNFNLKKDKINKGTFENSWLSILAELLDISRENLEQREKKRQRRKRITTTSLVSTIMLVLSALTIFAFLQRAEAIKQAVISKARLLAEQSINLTKSNERFRLNNGLDPSYSPTTSEELALLLSAEAIKLTKDDIRLSTAENILRKAMLGKKGYTLVGFQGTFPGTLGKWIHMDFDSNSHWLITSQSSNNDAILWNIKKAGISIPYYVLKNVAGTKEYYSNNSARLAMSSDGHWLVAGNSDGSVKLMNLLSDDPAGDPILLAKPNESYGDIIISPDSRWAALSYSDSTIKIWDLSSEFDNPKIVLPNSIKSIRSSSDSKLLLTTNSDSTLTIWNISEAAISRYHIPKKFNLENISANFSIDNKWIEIQDVDYSGFGLSVWEIIPGSKQANNKFSSYSKNGSYIFEKLEAAKFSNGGHWLFINEDKPKLIRLIPGFQVVKTFDRRFIKAAFSGNSNWLIIADSLNNVCHVSVIDLKKSPITANKLSLDSDILSPFQLDNSGKLLAVSSVSSNAKLFDLKDDTLSVKRIFSHSLPIAFSKDDSWLITKYSENGYTRWNLKDKSLPPYILNIPHYQYDEFPVCSPDGRWLIKGNIVSDNYRLYDFNIDAWFNSYDDSVTITNLPNILSTKINIETNHLAVYFMNGSIRTMDLNLEPPKFIYSRLNFKKEMITNHESNFIFTNKSGVMVTIFWFDYEKQGLKNIDLRNNDSFNINTDADVLIFNHESREEQIFRPIEPVKSYSILYDTVQSRISDDKNILISRTNDGRIKVYEDINKEIKIRNSAYLNSKLITLKDAAVPVKISPAGRWLVTKAKSRKEDNNIFKLWNLSDLSSAEIVDIHLNNSAARFSPNGKWLFTGRLYNLSKGVKQISTIDIPVFQDRQYVNSVNSVFSPNSRWLIFKQSYNGNVDYPGTYYIMNLAAKEPVSTISKIFSDGGMDPRLDLHRYYGSDQPAVFSGDNNWVAIKSDSTIIMLNLRSSNPTAEPFIIPVPDKPLAFSHGSKYLVAYSSGRIRMWPLEIEPLFNKASQIIGRNMTKAEWSEYFPGEPYRKIFQDLPGPQESSTFHYNY